MHLTNTLHTKLFVGEPNCSFYSYNIISFQYKRGNDQIAAYVHICVCFFFLYFAYAELRMVNLELTLNNSNIKATHSPSI